MLSDSFFGARFVVGENPRMMFYTETIYSLAFVASIIQCFVNTSFM